MGVVEADELLGPERVRAGDVVIGMDASGLHSNGYSLVRAVISAARIPLEQHIEDFGRTLGEEILEPTRIYTADLLAVLRDARTAGAVHALSHVTGGGLAANLARVMPRGLAARLDRSRWEPGAVFSQVARWGSVPQLDLEGTLNMGIGMVALVEASRRTRRSRCSPRAVWARVSSVRSSGGLAARAGAPLEHVVAGRRASRADRSCSPVSTGAGPEPARPSDSTRADHAVGPRAVSRWIRRVPERPQRR